MRNSCCESLGGKVDLLGWKIEWNSSQVPGCQTRKEGCIRFYSTIRDICSKGKHLFDPCFGHPCCFMDCLNMSFNTISRRILAFPGSVQGTGKFLLLLSILGKLRVELGWSKNLSDFFSKGDVDAIPWWNKDSKKQKHNILRWRKLH